MEAKQIRISEYAVTELRAMGKEIGEPTDDVIVRHIIAEYKRLRTENKLLKKELEECRKVKGNGI
jgi:hypothetical protein